MIVCPSSLKLIRINIQTPSKLEIVGIMACSTHSGCRMCILAVYRRPQQPLAAFLSLFVNYLAILPNMIPTIIIGDFNEDLLSKSTSSRLLQLMSSRGFSQLVQVPTTDSGSLLDHIYFNGVIDDTFMDVIDIDQQISLHYQHISNYSSFRSKSLNNMKIEV